MDSPGIGEGRCSSCGVEAYVTLAHLLAAAAIGAVILTAAPTARTRAALAIVACLAAAAVLFEPLLSLVGFAALVASLLVAPAMVAWWAWVGARRLFRAGRVAPADALAAAWVALLVLVPATFAWTWLDRVTWLTF